MSLEVEKKNQNFLRPQCLVHVGFGATLKVSRNRDFKNRRNLFIVVRVTKTNIKHK